ncbi:MAG: uroporphyrinogen decarboxylase family protein [Phycisphaeraceae bacterium]
MPDTATLGTTDTTTLTPRQRFIAALERRPLPGRVPHFELVFYLTMEAFGKVHPGHRAYGQWMQMSESERRLQRQDMAQLHIDTAQRYGHDAIYYRPNPDSVEEAIRQVEAIRQLSGDRYCILLPGDSTFSIPDGNGMEEMSLRMAEEPDKVEDEAKRRLDQMIQRAQRIKDHFGSGVGADGFALCADYCFNSGSFLPPQWFDRFVTPYLHQLTRACKDMGFYVLKHTDGNILPILDRLVPDDEACRPHALHSLDPQGGIDMADIVRRVGDKVALCGNVNCGLLQTGTDEQCIESARYALREGMKAPGYVFSTSNCVYTGMELRRYELILEVWQREGVRRSESF